MNKRVRDQTVPAITREATGEIVNAITITGDIGEVYLTQADLWDDKQVMVCIQVDAAQWRELRATIDEIFKMREPK